MARGAGLGGYFHLHADVRDAQREGRAVVALESTIITHGMPYPENLNTAREVEAIVRKDGATPATIAVLDGCIRIGLCEEEVERLARGKDVVKASSRDLPALVASGGTAGTTVSATMLAAAHAKIQVFATGGIGGVHRGATETFDISADLLELARTPVAVVCSGCKSILDIAKTLEFLETRSVPVLGYRTDDFPAFFARTSGHKVDWRFDEPREIGGVIDATRRLGLRTGLLIANPVPEEAALPADLMESHIAAACRDADLAGVSGKALTPFLLSRVSELTGGASLRTNIALIKSNARLAAQIAVAMAERNAAEPAFADEL